MDFFAQEANREWKGLTHMQLIVEQPAASWYKQQLELENGESVRIFVKLGGCSTVVPGLSLGVNKELPINPGLSTTVEGITFFIEEANLWYLDNKGLRITFDERHEEIDMIVE